ncbi:hypothetical protein B0H13DRAFT_296706 [Mycena leptocephala]|nr:hypothetical protein B0H13DRAFT_296706 [Mycena leptocephala]
MTRSLTKNISPRRLGSIDTESGDLSVIEHLLIASEYSASSIPDALAQRYLAGVLELPSFWQESRAIHITVVRKILDRVTRVLNDLSLDSDSDEGRDGILFDHEGIDSLASAILVGVLNWQSANPEPRYWHRSLTEIVRLLRLPRAELLLPTSSALATGPDIKNMIPDPAPDALDVLTMVNSDTEIPQTCSESDYISIGKIGEALSDPVQDLDFAPTIVYMEAVSMRTFRWTAISSAHRWSRKKLQENEPESAKARTWITEWFRGHLPRRNHHGEYTTSSETPTVNPSVHNHRFSTSGSSSRSSAHPVVDNPRDFGDSDVQASSGDQSSQNTPEPSPSPSPNVSPAPHYDLPDVSDPSAAPIVLSEQSVDGPTNLLAEGNTAAIWALEDSGPPGGESAGSFPNPFGGSQTLFNVLSPNPNWDHGSPIVASDLEDVETGRPVDPHHEQDKINADTDADSVQSISRRSQSSANEEFTFNFEDYVDTSSATTGVPWQGVLHPRAGADTPLSVHILALVYLI